MDFETLREVFEKVVREVLPDQLPDITPTQRKGKLAVSVTPNSGNSIDEREIKIGIYIDENSPTWLASAWFPAVYKTTDEALQNLDTMTLAEIGTSSIPILERLHDELCAERYN